MRDEITLSSEADSRCTDETFVLPIETVYMPMGKCAVKGDGCQNGFSVPCVEV